MDWPRASRSRDFYRERRVYLLDRNFISFGRFARPFNLERRESITEDWHGGNVCSGRVTDNWYRTSIPSIRRNSRKNPIHRTGGSEQVKYILRNIPVSIIEHRRNITLRKVAIIWRNDDVSWSKLEWNECGRMELTSIREQSANKYSPHPISNNPGTTSEKYDDWKFWKNGVSGSSVGVYT